MMYLHNFWASAHGLLHALMVGWHGFLFSKGRADRPHSVSVVLHDLSELTDVVHTVPPIHKFHVGIVNVPTSIFILGTVRSGNADFSSVWDIEKLVVPRVDKADTLLGLCHVLVKPFLFIAVHIEIVIPLVWVAL